MLKLAVFLSATLLSGVQSAHAIMPPNSIPGGVPIEWGKSPCPEDKQLSVSLDRCVEKTPDCYGNSEPSLRVCIKDTESVVVDKIQPAFEKK
jgi:hypothetical protein